MQQSLIRVSRKGLLILLLIICLLLGMEALPVFSPALASVHEYGEGPEKLMYRSLQTLRDNQGLAWQVVLFKQLERGQTTALHLRLVGFPGLVMLTHPAPLTVSTGEGQNWQATDITNLPTSSPNVGEYDVLEVLRAIDTTPPLRLTLPLEPQQRELVIPPFVVQEWQRVSRELF